MFVEMVSSEHSYVCNMNLLKLNRNNDLGVIGVPEGILMNDLAFGNCAKWEKGNSGEEGSLKKCIKVVIEDKCHFLDAKLILWVITSPRGQAKSINYSISILKLETNFPLPLAPWVRGLDVVLTDQPTHPGFRILREGEKGTKQKKS